MMTVEPIFWLSVIGVLYPYFGYPLLLRAIASRRRATAERSSGGPLPTVSMIVPVHNEERRLEKKIANTRALDYPSDRLQVIFISDGSTDRTMEMLRAAEGPGLEVVELNERAGKAAGLNAGLARATNDIVVFSDASITLEPGSMGEIVAPFADPQIGCVSGEDRIAESGGEGLYGRYELALRRLESRVHSIVGASGSFYAQRRALCDPFTEGMAPDFLSVLRTVAKGYRAISQESAVGSMTSVKDPKQEFTRKVRTLLRGMTTLFAHAQLLNPLRYGWFAVSLISHKVLRWLAPVFLIGTLVSPLWRLDSPWYLAALVGQLGFYAAAILALRERLGLHRSLVGRIALYFSSVNAAVLAAWVQYVRGVRQELWTPTRR